MSCLFYIKSNISKSRKSDRSSVSSPNEPEDQNGAQQIGHAKESTRIPNRNPAFPRASIQPTIYLNSVMDSRHAALVKHTARVHRPTVNAHDQSEQPTFSFGCSSDKLPKRVNICEFSFEPPVQPHSRYLEAQTVLHGVNLLKPSADIIDLLDQSVPATHFHLFSWLPFEVRQKIFRLIQPGPRVVELRYTNKIAHPASPSPVPLVFSICRESREEARKRYIMLYRDHWLIPRIWIDPEIDTLYLGKENMYGYGYVGRPYGISDREIHAHDFVNYFKNMLNNLQPAVWASLKQFGINEATYTKNAEYLKFYSRGCVHSKRSDISVLTQFEKLEKIAIVQDPGMHVEHTGPITLVSTTKYFCKECKKLSAERGGIKIPMEKKTCKSCYRRVRLLNTLAMDWVEKPRHNDTLKNDITQLLHTKWHPRYEFMIATRLDLDKLGLDY